MLLLSASSRYTSLATFYVTEARHYRGTLHAANAVDYRTVQRYGRYGKCRVDFDSDSTRDGWASRR